MTSIRARALVGRAFQSNVVHHYHRQESALNTPVTLSSARSAPRLSNQDLLRLADQCVKCGLCLPHCPTYAKTRHEADSPRGRIALVQGWLTGQLDMTPGLAAHLDGCLLCRACESACPSLVAYGRLLDGARARHVAMTPTWRRFWTGHRLGALSNARFMDALGRLASVYVGTGLARLVEIARLIRLRAIAPRHRLLRALAVTARPVAAQPLDDADLDLFVGCSGASAQGGAIAATRLVCERLGLRVRIASEAVCCGAMQRHNGFPEAADRAREQCAQVHGGRPLVGASSACIAELREHPALTQAQEVCDYLDRRTWPDALVLTPLARRVLVHEPCSHRRLLGGNAAVHRLLARIPGLEVAPLPDNDRCCGAAGTYLLQQPEMAAALLDDKLIHIRDLKPDIIVTTNPGCALHLLAGVRESGLAIEVCHPVELIARQLPSMST
ncbi:(Fe-S)-binding protein [Allochromatium vinosum]|uniref:(Fe-S)-binding protein n=1 Tax=Allochromatium vinosum TaxID=1049 RepID=UPI0001A7479F|nr:(Fe-S)-binding protein [Allochromatium vinosum]